MPYRDQAALATRHAELTKDLAEIQAKAKELSGLAAEEERVRRALVETEALLRDVAPRSAPLQLESLKVASPCSASWNEMTGDDRVRFCGKCDKNVFNLSAMSAPEAEALLQEKEGELCVRFFQRADGTVMTADCPVGVRRKRVRRLTVLAAAGGALSAAASMLLPHAALPSCDAKRSVMTSEGAASEQGAAQAHLRMGMRVIPQPPETLGRRAPTR